MGLFDLLWPQLHRSMQPCAWRVLVIRYLKQCRFVSKMGLASLLFLCFLVFLPHTLKQKAMKQTEASEADSGRGTFGRKTGAFSPCWPVAEGVCMFEESVFCFSCWDLEGYLQRRTWAQFLTEVMLWSVFQAGAFMIAPLPCLKYPCGSRCISFQQVMYPFSLLVCPALRCENCMAFGPSERSCFY